MDICVKQGVNSRIYRGEIHMRWIKKHKVWTSFIIVVMLISIYIYNNNTILLYSEKVFSKLDMTNYYMEYFIKPISKITDQFDLRKTRIGQKRIDLEIFDLKLSANDIKHFNELSESSVSKGYLDDENNTWRGAELIIDEVKYKVKVKLTGDLENHWKNSNKSYSLKFIDDYYNNIKRLDLKVAADKRAENGIYEIEKLLANELNIQLYREKKIGILNINGVRRGMYQIEEHIDDKFLEKKGVSTNFIIKQSDNWLEDLRTYRKITGYEVDSLGTTWGLSHNTPFVGEISNLDMGDDLEFSRLAIYEYMKIYENSDDFLEMIDLDQFASYYAGLMIFGNSHSFAGDNFKMVYDGTSRKFIPIFDCDGGTGELRGGVEKQIGYYDFKKYRMAEMLVLNDEFRMLRNEKLYQIVSDEKINQKIHNIIDKNRHLFLYDPLSRAREVKYESWKANNLFENNINLLKNTIEYATLYTNVVQKSDRILVEIIPDTFSGIQFLEGQIKMGGYILNDYEMRLLDENGEILSGKIVSVDTPTKIIDLMEIVRDFDFIAGLDNNLELVKRKYCVEIIPKSETGFEVIDSFWVKATNSITNKEIKENDTYISIANGKTSYDKVRYQNISKWLLTCSLPFKQIGDNLWLDAGKYKLYDDLIIPQGTIVNLDAGVIIEIAENKSILSYSPVIILGSEDNLVVIKKMGIEPFGVVGIVGNENESVNINYLDLSGGNEAYIDGLFLSGGLSIYHVDNIKIKNSNIHNNNADDGMNIKYSNDILINNCYIHDNFADQIDLDYCKGYVMNTLFEDSNGDDNGDGLDLSGSKIRISNCYFNNFSDKGISIGERTDAIVMFNSFNGNRSAITAKDSSNIFIYDNEYENNEIQIEEYQKKQIYNFPNVFNLNDEVSKIILDEGSRYFKLDNNYSFGELPTISILEELKTLEWKEVLMSND